MNEFELLLLTNGFKLQDDPNFKYALDLSSVIENNSDIMVEHDDTNPSLLFDITSQRFVLWTGINEFIYTNHTTPQEAINWAKQISHVDSN